MFKSVNMFSRILPSFKNFSEGLRIPTLTFSEVRKEIDKLDAGTLLLDVREKDELISDGKLKGSVNIPLGEVESAVKLDEVSFKNKYGFDKPSPDDSHIIIHCKAGVRAMKAAVVFHQAGYDDVSVYSGILDWLSNGGEIS